MTTTQERHTTTTRVSVPFRNPSFPKNCFRLATCLLLTLEAIAGPKGKVHAHYLPTPPVIDGRLSDWPMDQYVMIAQHPEFPEVRDSESSFADGDQIVFSLDRVGRFNNTTFNAWFEGGRFADFGSTVQIGYDFRFLYILAVTFDDVERADRDTSEFGSAGRLNDGFGFLIDAQGDSADCVAQQAFPEWDTESPNTDDFEVTVALNQRFKPTDAEPSEIGARQVCHRAGTRALLGSVLGGPGGTYRDSLDRARGVDGQRDIVARHFDDLRLAGGTNPEFSENPEERFSGFVIEMRIPFHPEIGFSPDHDMGFELFWRDADQANDPGRGQDDVCWGAWTQSTRTDCANPQHALLNAANWATLVFDEPEKPRMRKQGENLVLSWPGPGRLLRTDSLVGGGQWSPVEDATSPYVIRPDVSYRFYRVER